MKNCLERLRRERGVRQEELADAVGMRHGAIYNVIFCDCQALLRV